MFPVTSALSVRWRCSSSQSLLALTILSHALRDFTPTTSTFHHSLWLLLSVATIDLSAVLGAGTGDRRQVDRGRVVDAVPRDRALQGALRRGEPERDHHVERVEAGRGRL